MADHRAGQGVEEDHPSGVALRFFFHSVQHPVERLFNLSAASFSRTRSTSTYARGPRAAELIDSLISADRISHPSRAASKRLLDSAVVGRSQKFASTE
jgi:hypothetical protein